MNFTSGPVPRTRRNSHGSRRRHPAEYRVFRFTLPVAIAAGQHGGAWHALLKVNDREFKKALSGIPDRDKEGRVRFATHGARYSLVVHSYSNLRMTATVTQTGYAPSASLRFRASLSEYGMPVVRRARGEVELTRPGGAMSTLPMAESEPGVLEAATAANDPGVYHARILARGSTLRGTPFTREAIGSAAIWRGGDAPYEPPRDTQSREEWCRLIACLFSEKNVTREFEERMKAQGLNIGGVRDCLRTACRKRGKRQGI